jgi:hypothetical protein
MPVIGGTNFEQTRAEQIAAQLEMGHLEIDTNEATRSPSPPPIYDSNGQRINTREVSSTVLFRIASCLSELVHCSQAIQLCSGITHLFLGNYNWGKVCLSYSRLIFLSSGLSLLVDTTFMYIVIILNHKSSRCSC